MDLSFYWDQKKLERNKTNIKKIFFYRVCGTGMGALAKLLKDVGYWITGGDYTFYPPMSTYLDEVGIPTFSLQNLAEEQLKEFDLIIVGNVVARNSEDAKLIESLGVPFCSFPSALGALVLDGREVVGVAGTHGKTTTTYLFTQVFRNLGMDPGHFIGGVLSDLPSSHLGKDDLFFIESDEYDSSYFEKRSKFHYYKIDHLFLTSLEYDHADIFENLDAIKDEFRNLLPNVTSSFTFSEDYEASLDLASFSIKSGPSRLIGYGKGRGGGPFISYLGQEGSRFELTNQGKRVEFFTNLVGVHNILNLTSVILFALEKGHSIPEIRRAILDLKLAKRRQEVRGIYRGSLVIDDFAHHPKAVKVTIDAIKIQYPDKRIMSILEPNSATGRTSIFQKEFPKALENSDLAVVARPRSTGIPGRNDLNCHQLIEDFSNLSLNKEGHLAQDLNSLRALIDKKADSDTIILIMSNSTCLGLWESDFVSQLSN